MIHDQEKFKLFWEPSTGFLTIISVETRPSSAYRAVLIQRQMARIREKAENDCNDDFKDLSFDDDLECDAEYPHDEENQSRKYAVAPSTSDPYPGNKLQQGEMDLNSQVGNGDRIVVPWVPIGKPATQVINVGPSEGLTVAILECAQSEGRVNFERIATIAKYSISSIIEPDRASNSNAKVDSGRKPAQLDRLQVLGLPTGQISENKTDNRQIFSDLIGPAEKKQLIKKLRLALANSERFDTQGQILPFTKNSQEESCLVLAPVKDEKICPSINTSIQAQDLTRVEARLTLRESTFSIHGKVMVPTLTVRITATLNCLTNISKRARIAHWRRQEDYLWSERKAAQRFYTGISIVDALSDVPVTLPDARQRVPSMGLYLYEFPVQKVKVVDDEIILEFTLEDVRHGDVIGILFLRGTTEVGVLIPDADDSSLDTWHILDQDTGKEHALWVYRGDQLVFWSREAALLTSATLKYERISKGCEEALLEITSELSKEDAVDLFPVKAYRSQSKHWIYSFAENAIKEQDDLQHFDELPIAALDAYRTVLSELKAIETAVPHSNANAALSLIVAEARRASRFYKEPTLSILLSTNAPFLVNVTKSNNWPNDNFEFNATLHNWPRESIPHLFYLAGRQPALCLWCARLSPEAQLCAWIIFCHEHLTILDWLCKLGVAPDVILLNELAVSAAGAESNPQRHDALNLLRQAIVLMDELGKLEAIAECANEAGHNNIARIANCLLAAGSLRDKNGSSLTYGELAQLYNFALQSED